VLDGSLAAALGAELELGPESGAAALGAELELSPESGAAEGLSLGL
jgi:hypothetical protein